MDKVFENIERPFAWLDLDALDDNIAYVKAACGDKNVRIATKSIRSIEILRYIERQLPNCSGFMTFTASETLYLLERGFDRLLLGYPTFEESSVQNIVHFVRHGRDVTFMVDALEQVEFLQQIAEQNEVQFQICIDINVSTDYKVLYFGTKRSPLHSLTDVEQLLQRICSYTGVVVTSCMAYDAQIAGVTDKTQELFGLKSALISQLKKHSMPQVTHLRRQAVALIDKKNALRFVNAGGSGSMYALQHAEDITEITVGSAFYAPALFSQYHALQLKPAAGFGLRITRMFSDEIVVCHGGGYIASGAVGSDRLPKFLEPKYYAFTPLEGAGEVQTPIIVKDRKHQIGDTIYFRHAKAGELCERFNYLHAKRGSHYAGAIQTYRGDGKCFL